MKQIGNSNEDMIALLEAVVGIKNELLYIREYFHPLLKGEIYLSGEQVCEMLHISKRTLCKLPHSPATGFRVTNHLNC